MPFRFLQVAASVWLFVLALIFWVPTSAHAGSMALLGVGSVGSAPLSPVTLTYQANGRSSASSNVETFTISFQSALAANQLVAVFFNDGNIDGSGPIVSATFTPNIGSPVTASITNAGEDSNQHFTSLCATAVMPTGATSATLSVTLTGTVFSGSSYGVYTLNNAALSSSTPTYNFTQWTTAPASSSIATPSGSGLVASFFNYGVSSGEAWTAGVTSDTGGVNFNNDFGHISNATASAGYTVSYTWTSGPGNPDLTLWVFR